MTLVVLTLPFDFITFDHSVPFGDWLGGGCGVGRKHRKLRPNHLSFYGRSHNDWPCFLIETQTTEICFHLHNRRVAGAELSRRTQCDGIVLKIGVLVTNTSRYRNRPKTARQGRSYWRDSLINRRSSQSR